MNNLFGNLNILEILRVGLSGLIFLLSFLAYRLINREQQRPSNPRKGILQTIYIFMGINVLSAVMVIAAGYFQSPENAKTDIAELTQQNQRYRVLMSELASTINAKVEYEVAQEQGSVATLKPSINALVKTIATARQEGLVDN